VGLAVAIVGGVLACGQLVGIEEDPPTTLTCGSLLAGDCQTCGVAQCCAELSACAASAPCRTLETCINACNGDPACRAQCASDHPIANDPTMAAVLTCLASSCESQCGPSCGWLADYVSPEAAPGCQSCIVGQACQTVNDCLTNPACAAATVCTASSVTGDVNEACKAELFDGGTTTWNAMVVQLLNGKCGTQCDLYQNWSCIGHVSWPRATTSSIMLTFHASDLSSTPVPGLATKLCAVSDPACAAPLSTQTTDDAGVATVVAPIPNGPGYVGPTGYLTLESDAGAVIPELYFWSFPVSEPMVQFGDPTVVTPDQADALAASFKVTLDTSLGDILAVALDCNFSHANGVQFALSAPDGGSMPPPFYVGGVDATNKQEPAVFFNVPPGWVTLTATPKGLGRPSSVVSLLVRPGTLTEVNAPPSQ
jgi:hypothetical protein